jgi:UDP-N-acetyl-2-amino-2-deoxyglucuronate dehydrogenase
VRVRYEYICPITATKRPTTPDKTKRRSMSLLKFAIIGAGSIARTHAQAIAQIPEAKVTVICNRSEESGRSLAAAHGATWVATFDEAVRRPDVDVVAICTPSGLHLEPALAAAAAGKHLLVEKPLEITLDRIDQMIAAAQTAGVLLAAVFQQRYARGIQEAKAAVESGRLGQMVLADAYVKWHRPQRYYDGSWHGTWALDGGGALMNQAIHSIDLLQWIMGPVTTVFGRTATLAHEEMETEDTASALLTFGNGAMGVIQGATSSWPGNPARLELHGDRGVIIVEEGQIVKWKLADAGPGEEERMLNLEKSTGSGASDPTAIGFELHRRQIADLVEAIQQRRPPAVTGAEGRKSVEIVRAIYHSAARDRLIRLPLTDDTPTVQTTYTKESLR